jgi:hypothetical protein
VRDDGGRRYGSKGIVRMCKNKLVKAREKWGPGGAKVSRGGVVNCTRRDKDGAVRDSSGCRPISVESTTGLESNVRFF